ncbi:MAG: hypothetical protein SGBAC_011796, partial [Bacillariaceae sp.]
MAELELALEESQRRRAALEDELMSSMAESVLNRTPQTALAELDLAKMKKESATESLIKATTGLLGPIGGIAGVSLAGVAAGRNALQRRQAKIEETERQAFEARLDATLKSEKKSFLQTTQKVTAAAGVTALGVTLSGPLNELSLPSLGGNSPPTASIKNEQKVTQTKVVEPKAELPYLEAKIKQAELEVQAKEKAVLEATQKSQRLEQLLQSEAESSRTLQAQLQTAKEAAEKATARVSSAELAAKEAADKATARVSSAELAAKEAEARALAKELAAKEAAARALEVELAAKEAAARAVATGSPAPITNNDIDKKEENGFATRKKEEAESLNLKRKVAEGMSGMGSITKPSSLLSSKPTNVAISTPTAGVAATALESPFDFFSKMANSQAALSVTGGVIAAAGTAAVLGFMKNKDEDDRQTTEKNEDTVRATMKISKGNSKKKKDELPFNIPPPPKEIASPSTVSKRGDGGAKSSFASSSSVEGKKPKKSGTQTISSQTTSNVPKGSTGPGRTTPKFMSSYEGTSSENSSMNSSSSFGPGVGASKGTAFQAGADASKVSSKFGASTLSGAPPFGPNAGAPKGSSPFQAVPGASKFASSPKGTPSFGPNSKGSSKEGSLFFTGATTGSPLGPGSAPKVFGAGPGVPKGFGTGSSSINGQNSVGGSVESPAAGAPKGFSSPRPATGFNTGAPKGFSSSTSNGINGMGGVKGAGSSPVAPADSTSSPFGTNLPKGTSQFGPRGQGSQKGGSSFFTGASTGSPLGPGSAPKVFGASPGVPKGFGTGASPVNGQKSGSSSVESPAAGAPKGFSSPSSANGFNGSSSSTSNGINGMGGVKGAGSSP